ncbi:hypothetical protein ThesiDRAFT1_2012 [Thermoanaerobacter siderophilus SR4]|uniref:Uncharacterized protein n=1 Tax=Thermoanaerobacter siderophilus SR4 TaxID=880478 RepID=I8R5W2_9THEO|nr:hypothetical protein ThesiDRAFT1_2012 [Thermoanaerobacter siderophilus SR4]
MQISLLTKLKNIQRRYFASSLRCSKATKLKLDLRAPAGYRAQSASLPQVPASAIHGFGPASTLGLAKFCYRFVTSRSLCKISPLRKFVYSLICKGFFADFFMQKFYKNNLIFIPKYYNKFEIFIL